MFLLWIVASVGAVTGLLSLLAARRASRRLASLSQSYWELRYEQGRLRALLTSAQDGEADAGDGAGRPPASDPDTAFVPLSTLKRR